LRAVIPDFIQPVVAIRPAAEKLVAVNPNRSAAAGLLLELRHRTRFEVVHKLADVHGYDRPGVPVDDVVDRAGLAHSYSTATGSPRSFKVPSFWISTG